MRRNTLLALAAIALLGAGSVAFVARVTSDGGLTLPQAPEPPAPAEAEVASAPPAPPRPVVEPARRPAGPGPARALFTERPESPSVLPLADRVTRKLIRRALLAAPIQATLADCVDRDAGFSVGGAPGGVVPRAAAATLLLELETREGEVRVTDVGVERWGGASEPMIRCARQALDGLVARGPGIAGDQRLRMPYPLEPRMAVAAAAPVPKATR